MKWLRSRADPDLRHLGPGLGGMGRTASRRFVNDVAVEAELLDRATNICLALPEATADDRHPPHRGFLVGRKNFAWFVVDEHGDGRIGLGVRAAPGENEELVATDPERFGCRSMSPVMA